MRTSLPDSRLRPLHGAARPLADQQVLGNIDPLLSQGISAEQSIAIAFLASPDLQLALERLEISRSDFVAASTPPNPGRGGRSS